MLAQHKGLGHPHALRRHLIEQEFAKLVLHKLGDTTTSSSPAQLTHHGASFLSPT